MRAQVQPEAGTGHIVVPPAVQHLRLETVIARLELHQPAQLPLLHHLFQAQKIRVKAAALVDREHPALRLRQRQQILGLGQRDSAGFVNQHMLAGQQGGASQRMVAVIGCGDHHQFNGRVGKSLCGCGQHRHARPGRMHGCGLAADDGRQLKPGHSGHHRRMKVAPGIAKANQRTAQR